MASDSNQVIATNIVAAPITALAFHGEHLLSGEGAFLKIYQVTQGKHICEKEVLNSAVIHGICKGPDSHYVIYGQKSVCIVSVQICDHEHVQISVPSTVCELPDWIWNVCWLEEQLSSQLAIVLAHNSVVRWDWRHRLVLQHVHCAENCILYSALLIGNTWDSLTVAVGTVFNQVVIWKPSSQQDSTQRCAVQKRLSGHQGVIFNISYHADRRQLCSVSDDRSIRLWATDGDATAVDNPVLVLYGHAARVWDCELLDDVITSIGEDATCKVWSYSGELLHTFTGHKGCSIWSLAVDKDKRILATGGGDSSIRIWRLDNKQQAAVSTTDLVTVDMGVVDELHWKRDSEVLPALGASDLAPRHVTVTNTGEVLVLAQCGALLGYQLSSQTWRCLMYDPQYQSYGVLSVAPNSKMAALGNIDGHVKVLCVDKLCVAEKRMYKSKVLNIMWASSEDLFTSGPGGHLDWLKVTMHTDRIDTINLILRAKFILPPARQHWATAVTVLPDEDGIVCGDRRGSLHLYRCYSNTFGGTHSNTGESSESLHHQPCHSLFGIHGKTGVTSVCLHEGMIYSTGRDGTYRQYTVEKDEEGIAALQLLNTFKVSKGFQWLERIIFTSDREMQILGFHTNQFIVWSVTRSERLIEVECGGGHRTWGYTVSDAGSDHSVATFACVKAQQVFIHQVPWQLGSRQSIVKQALHGNQVTCVKHLATFSSVDKGSEYAVCATGSEDTTVNIVMLYLNPSRPSNLKILERLQAHISRVCAMASCPSRLSDEDKNKLDQSQSVLLFSVGGRCALQCWRVNLKQQNGSSLPDVCCQVEHLVSYGTVDGVERRRLLKKSADLVDPETRYMDVTVWHGAGSTPSVHIAVTGSDACVRLFSLDESRRIVTLQSVTQCHDACVLSVTHLTYQSNDFVATLLMTAATNRNILVWDTRQGSTGNVADDALEINNITATSKLHQTSQSVQKTLGKSLLKLQHHQSGVNCLSSVQLQNDIYLIASGGDDNSVCVSIIQLNSRENNDIGVKCLNTYQVPTAHAAQVSGLHFISQSCLVSASVDQRINVWMVEVSADYHSITKVKLSGSKFTHIADVSCMDLWFSRSGIPHLIISGQGLQVLHIAAKDQQHPS